MFPKRIALIVTLGLALSAPYGCAQPPGQRVSGFPFTGMEMPGAFNAIEQCRTNRSREQVREKPDEPLTVSCADRCIASQFNSWLALAPENRHNYFDFPSVDELSEAAGLTACMALQTSYTAGSTCFGPLAPDILVKTFHTACGEVIECEARFRVDEEGRAADAAAICPAGPVRAELERETLCLLRGMSFSGFRGRANLVQPF